MKQNKIVLIVIISILGLAVVSNFSSVSAVSIYFGEIKVDSNNTKMINNTHVPKFINVSGVYGKSLMLGKTKGFEIKKNIMTTKYGNKKYTFKTEYFLPMSGKEGKKTKKTTTEYWYNCQSIAIDSKYMYVLVSSGYNLNKGFIVRYDMDLLKKYKINKGSGLSKLRKLGASLRDNKKLTRDQKILRKAIKIGPIFNTGHAQSLAYNPKTKSLWMWQDNNPNSTDLTLMQINMKKLKPSAFYKFSMNCNGYKVPSLNNLAFDSEGNFYTNRVKRTSSNPNGSEMIFTGKIYKNEIKIKLLTTIKNRPGKFTQSIAVNRKTNRLYLVSDGVFYSMPLSKLKSGSLAPDDLWHTVLNTKREFEGISFDKYGKSYLLVLRGTEVLKSEEL